jgi:hypothetical protein
LVLRILNKFTDTLFEVLVQRAPQTDRVLLVGCCPRLTQCEIRLKWNWQVSLVRFSTREQDGAAPRHSEDAVEVVLQVGAIVRPEFVGNPLLDPVEPREDDCLTLQHFLL